MPLHCSPRGRTGRGRGHEGGGLYPELAAYRISEGSSPNVQAEGGRLAALLPIEQARAELARRGLESDEKAVRRIANELGAQMLATRTRDLLRFRRGELPAGEELAGKRVAAALDGGRVRVRTVIKKVRVGGRIKRQPFKVEWREPKLLMVFETDARGRMAKGADRSSSARCAQVPGPEPAARPAAHQPLAVRAYGRDRRPATLEVVQDRGRG